MVVFLAAAFSVCVFVLRFLWGVLFTGAFFADARLREDFLAALLFGAFFATVVFAGAFGRGVGLPAAASGAVRKSTASLVKFVASSIFDICEASSVTNLEPLMELATKAPIPGGVDRSCRPAMQNLVCNASNGFAQIHVASSGAGGQIAGQRRRAPSPSRVPPFPDECRGKLS